MSPKRFLKYYLVVISIFILFIYVIFPLRNIIGTRLSEEYSVASEGTYVAHDVPFNGLGNFPRSMTVKYSDDIEQTKIETKVFGEKEDVKIEVYVEKDWEKKWEVKQIIIKDEG